MGVLIEPATGWIKYFYVEPNQNGTNSSSSKLHFSQKKVLTIRNEVTFKAVF